MTVLLDRHALTNLLTARDMAVGLQGPQVFPGHDDDPGQRIERFGLVLGEIFAGR